MSDVINLREFRIRKLKLLMNSSDSSKEIKERLDKLQHSEVAMNRLLADLGLGGKENGKLHNDNKAGRKRNT